MNNLKKLLIAIISLSIIVFYGNVAYATEDGSINNQEDAYNAYLNLSKNLNIRMDMVSEDYPDTFGGCYLDGSNLVILVTKLSPEIENYYMSACETKDKIIFRQVPYSYEYLLNIEEKAVMETESKANVYEYYVDIKTNTINIGVDKIYDVDSSKISSFPIVLYKTENIPKLTAMRGGEIITSIKSCSICFFGTYNGKASLITCGHSNPQGQSVYYNGNYVGNVVRQNLKTFIDFDGKPSSYGDFSIVDISNSPISGSNYVNTDQGSITASGTANLLVGLSVKMYGGATGCISGTVQSTSVSINYTDPETYEDIKVKGLVAISGPSVVASGDSGGCAVYTTTTGINRIAGSITGCKEGVCSYITPSSYIETNGFYFN